MKFIGRWLGSLAVLLLMLVLTPRPAEAQFGCSKCDWGYGIPTCAWTFPFDPDPVGRYCETDFVNWCYVYETCNLGQTPS